MSFNLIPHGKNAQLEKHFVGPVDFSMPFSIFYIFSFATSWGRFAVASAVTTAFKIFNI